MDEAAKNMIANLEAKTGKSMDDWIAIARACGEEKHAGIMKRLKGEHGLTHGYANLVALMARESHAGASKGDDLIAAQYAGPRAGLKPIYDALAARLNGFGSDVELAPNKAYVSLRRSKQFGCIQPSTKTRLDLGLVLKDREPSGRLEAAGSWNAMVTHRVKLASTDDIDEEVLGWLREAYEAG